MYRIGIDVGGTFTDLVAVDADGRVDAGQSRLDAARSVDRRDGGACAACGRVSDLTLAGAAAETERIVHGTTVATNALLEHKGAKVGLLTTEGHRDVIEMREGLKDDRYNLRMPPPEPLVPRARRLGVRERMRADGRVETPLDAASLDAAIAHAASATASRRSPSAISTPIAIPRHERATADGARRAPCPASTSRSRRDVLPQIKEFERVSTTMVNAYVGPGAVALPAPARRAARRRPAIAAPVLIMQSHGGVAPIAEAARLAAGAVLSGPAGGVAGSRYAARLLDARQPHPLRHGRHQHGHLPDRRGRAGAGVRSQGRRATASRCNSLDIVSLGAGGGSIGRVDAGGILHVGPGERRRRSRARPATAGAARRPR